MIPCNLIFEGMGNVGKTTLIKSLVENIRGITVRNYKMSVPECADEGYDQFDNYNYVLTNNTDSVVIFDRGHISEMVYAPVYRQYYNHKYHQFLQDIDVNLSDYCHVPTYIVYVYPQWQSIIIPGTRVTDDLIAIPRLYEEIISYTEIKTIRISTHRKYTALWRPQYEIVTELLGRLQ